jgi:hypothetical protein
MKRWTGVLSVVTILAVGALAAPQAAEAHGRGGGHGAVIVGGFSPWPYYGYGLGFGYCGFWGPCLGSYGGYGFYDPYYSSGLQMGIAAANGIGAVDFSVKPGDAEVWVDGKFVAEARDLDGSPGLLWLRDGSHRVVVYKGGYRSIEEDVAVQPGQMLNFKARLDKGESSSPGHKPGAKASPKANPTD